RAMSKWLLGLCIALLCGALAATDAEARRLGGSRSVGTQRNVTPPPVSTPAKPAQQQAAQPAGSSWMPILGGLALGGLLGYLFSGSGLGRILLLALLPIGVVLPLRALAHRRAPSQAMRDAGHSAGGLRRGVDPRQASRRLERLAARRHPANALRRRLSSEKATHAVAFCFALNHLLDAAPWARERLAPFAGESLELSAPP